MIKYMNIEAKLKRISLIVAIGIIVAYSILILFQYTQFNFIHKEQIKTYQSIVGALVEKYPEQESEIVNSILNKNKDKESYGNKVLNRYGYNLELTMIEDPTFKVYRSKYISSNLVFTALILAINIFIILGIGKYIFKYLERISNVLENFIKGDYGYKDDFNDEGIVNIISNQLNQLGRVIEQKNNTLENEKESAKALVTDISHQLKTPLASISLCNSILEDEGLTEEEKEEFLNRSNENVKKLQLLIDSLVNISRLEVAMIKLKPEINNINDTILKAYNSAYIKAKNKGILLNIESLVDCNLKHDVKWTEEAIFNVLDNAIKYTDTEGKIKISTKETANYVKMYIEDTGIGIDKKEFNDIFKRFYRGKSEKVNLIEGSGVGLYLTRKILEDQGGSIMVKSTIGKGTTFTLLLPK